MTPRYLSPQAAARAESELLRAELDRTAARSKVLPASPPAVPPCSAPLQCPPGSAPISPWQCPGVLSYARIASRPPRMRAPRPSRRLQTRPLLTNPAPIVDRPRHRRRICAPPSSRYLFITPPRHRRRSAHLRARVTYLSPLPGTAADLRTSELALATDKGARPPAAAAAAGPRVRL